MKVIDRNVWDALAKRLPPVNESQRYRLESQAESAAAARRARAAALLEVVADADRLAVLEMLAEGSRPAETLDPAALDALTGAGLVNSSPCFLDAHVGLTPAGRDVWMGVRALVR